MKVQPGNLVFAFLFGGLLIIVISCSLFLYLTLPRPGIAQLCQDLRVQDDELCRLGSSPYKLLHIAFEPGKTKRGEVHTLMKEYFVEAQKRPVGGVRETYVLYWTPLGETQGYFDYDENDILIAIDVSD